MKKIVIILIVAVLIAPVGFVYWKYFGRLKNDSLNLEFFKLLQQSQQGNISLESIASVDWDEAVFWPPYGNLCDLGLMDYPKDGLYCPSSHSDSESYIILVKNNYFAGRIKVNRIEIDFVDSGFNRLARQKTHFEFVTKGQFPKVKVIELK